MGTKRLLLSFLMGAGLICATPARIPVVLSTDVGNEIDDQWAIVYLLSNPRFDVRGIISAHAPSLVPPAAHTSYLILRDVVEKRMGLTVHPPLLEGSSLSLKSDSEPQPNASVDFLIETSREFSPQNRLTVLTIGAVTDAASAILKDPSIANRIRIIDMGFKSWQEGGDEFNILNDVKAMQVLLHSDVPLVVGAADVCRATLSLTLDQAREMVAHRGPIGEWLWQEYQEWYYRNVKPLRKNDLSKSWVIWDIITLAYALDMTTATEHPRPLLRDGVTFDHVATDKKITWITNVDSSRLWADFLKDLDLFQRTHAAGETH
jgi:inosine-uridine nucleoside N-ribohydrolase